MLKAVMVVRPQHAEVLCQRLLSHDWVDDLVAVECRGYGRQKGHLQDYRGGEYRIDFLPKVLITATIAPARADELIDVVCTTCRTGQIGDGKVFLLAIDAELSMDGQPQAS